MKKGLSTIVSTMLILLLVFVAVGVLWVVVRNVIQSGTEQVSLGKFTLDLSIENVEISGNALEVKIKRNPGAGEFTGLSFIVDDGESTEVVEIKNISMREYSVRTFSLPLTSGISPNNVKSIEVAPIFTLSSGKEVVGDVKDSYETSEDSSSGRNTNNCGNNQLDSGEDCDGSLLGGADCASVLGSGYTGTLSCQSESCQYDTSSCVAPVSCGNGVIEGSEGCDNGTSLNGVACTANYDGSCTYCSSSCQTVTVTGDYCGDGTIQSSYEECDSADFGGETCESQMGTGYTGSLSCSDCSIDTSGCNQQQTSTTITVSAREQHAGTEYAHLYVYVNGVDEIDKGTSLGMQEVTLESFSDYVFTTTLTPAEITNIVVGFDNDHYNATTGEDRNMYVESILVDSSSVTIGAATCSHLPFDGSDPTDGCYRLFEGYFDCIAKGIVICNN